MKAKCVERQDKNYKKYDTETVIEILTGVINGDIYNTEEKVNLDEVKAVSNIFKLESGEFVKIKVAKTEADLY